VEGRAGAAANFHGRYARRLVLRLNGRVLHLDRLPVPLCDVACEINHLAAVIRLNWAGRHGTSAPL